MLSDEQADERLAGPCGKLKGDVQGIPVLLLILAKEICLMRPEMLDRSVACREILKQCLRIGSRLRRRSSRLEGPLYDHGCTLPVWSRPGNRRARALFK